MSGISRFASRLYTSAAFVCLLSLTSLLAQAGADQGQSWKSESGLFLVSYSSGLDPIEINEIHNWILHVETAEGEPINNAEITIDGGMPMHNHGLPTNPTMTQGLGDGDYRIEGMRFHMMGQWEVRITVTAGGDSDSVIIPLSL